MASAILAIVDAITSTIAALTPSAEATHLWTPSDPTQDLERAHSQLGRPLRSFAVSALMDAGHLSWNGDLARATQTLEVVILYYIPDAEGGWQRAARLGAADCAQLTHALSRPSLNIAGLVEMLPSPAQVDLQKKEDTYFARMLFDAKYFESGA